MIDTITSKDHFVIQRNTQSAFIIIIIINPLTAKVVGAPQIILQPVFSIFPCSPPPSGTCRTPDLSIPRCCLPTSSSACLVFFPLSFCFARWFWPDLCFGPSQPLGIISRLKTNFDPSRNYSAHKSFNTNHDISHHHLIINPLNARVLGAP